MADELKPCPFCGGEASASSRMDEDLSTHNQVEWKNVGCDNCEVYFEIPDGYDCGTAGEQWNTRPAPKADSALVGELAYHAETLQNVKDVLANGAHFADDPECHPLYPNYVVAVGAVLAALSDRDVVLEGLLRELAGAEAHYRLMHDTHGDGHMKAGRAWDLMRRAGDKARAALKGGVDE